VVLNKDIEAARARVRATCRGATCMADGVWDTCGFRAMDGSYVITDQAWLNALLAYRHACKRGRPEGRPDGVKWDGTSHAMEGYLAQLCSADLVAAGVMFAKL
jgi:hypothetical protein